MPLHLNRPLAVSCNAGNKVILIQIFLFSSQHHSPVWLILSDGFKLYHQYKVPLFTSVIFLIIYELIYQQLQAKIALCALVCQELECTGSVQIYSVVLTVFLNGTFKT